MTPPPRVIVLALAFTLGVLALGYVALGFWTMLVFTSGFLGGFVLWTLAPNEVPFASIKVPYIATFVLFVGHRVEEKLLGFFAELARLTGHPTPAIVSWPVIALVLASAGAWLLIPALVKRRHPFGYYLAWTFFTAMGITELAHFVFPLFRDERYGYFPGMASVVLLAPVAWWGMWRLAGRQR